MVHYHRWTMPLLATLSMAALVRSVGAARALPVQSAGLRVTVQTGPGIGIGGNLIPNGGFEAAEEGRPKGWSWSPRNTDATFSLVEDARSGKCAVRITNNTPHGPHIYGQMLLTGGLHLTPGETYTFSLYAKGDDPGIAWAGGGDGWWMRLSLGRTGGKWRRFPRTFVAREKDAVFPLMVNTDGPTAGFAVDGLKLEKGDLATPFFDPSAADRPVELVAEVPPLLSCPGIPAKPDEPARFDWLTFHQDQVARWFEWLAGEVKQRHPKAILSNKPMAWTLLDPEEGVDWEREAEPWEIPGCDASRSPDNSTYSFGWVEPAMLFDFQKSVAPGKPLADHEYHYVHWPNVSSEYVRATYFHSTLHGLRMSQFWVWSTGQIGPGAAGAGMKHTAWSQPKVAWGTATSALDLRRLAATIAAFPGRPEVYLYHSRPSLYLDHGVAKGTLHRVYQAANGLEAPVGFMTDRMIRAGKLRGCKLLVVPGARFVEKEVRAAIADYARKGGRVVLVGECLVKDEYGRPHAESLGVPETHLQPADGRDTRELVGPLEKAFAAAGVTRPVRCRREDGRPAWPVECRTAMVGGQRVCALVGLNREPMRVRLTSDRPICAWEDLITGAKGTGTSLELQPLDVRLLRLELGLRASAAIRASSRGDS